jgi:hypothetical protein
MNAVTWGKIIFLANLASALLMTGVIWFVQVVHYPLFARVGEIGYAQYQATHQSLTTFVVMPPMLIEMGTAWLLLIWRPPQVSGWVVYIGLALVIALWLSTFFLQVPRHEMLSSGFNAQAHQMLVSSNWIRTWGWSLRSILLLYSTWRMLK